MHRSTNDGPCLVINRHSILGDDACVQETTCWRQWTPLQRSTGSGCQDGGLYTYQFTISIQPHRYRSLLVTIVSDLSQGNESALHSLRAECSQGSNRSIRTDLQA